MWDGVENADAAGEFGGEVVKGDTAVVSGQDETVFNEFAYSKKQWIISGFRGMRKKSAGRGRHLSGTQSELRGVGFPITAEELQIVNSFRARRGRPPLDCSPGMRFLDFGKDT